MYVRLFVGFGSAYIVLSTVVSGARSAQARRGHDHT